MKDHPFLFRTDKNIDEDLDFYNRLYQNLPLAKSDDEEDGDNSDKHIRLAQKFTSDEKRVLLEVFGGLPLEKLEIDLMLQPKRFSLLPIEGLNDVLNQHRDRYIKHCLLTSLKLSHCVLSGTKDDYATFAAALEYHPTLAELELRFLGIENPLDPLLKALSTVVTLEKVVLDMEHSNKNRNIDTISVIDDASSLGHLGKSKTLRFLTLGWIHLSNEHVAALTGALKSSTTLKYLKLSNCLSEAGSITMFADMLRTNESLERLILDGENMHIDDDEIIAVTTSLSEKNTTLKELDITTNGREQYRQSSSSDIISNRDAAFLRQANMPRVYQSIIHMLQHNFSLQFLLIDTETLNDGNIKAVIDFYLKLNRAGRFNLLCNENGKKSTWDWITALAYVKDDLDCLFYFVSSNPSICSLYLNGEDDVGVSNRYDIIDQKQKERQQEKIAKIPPALSIVNQQSEAKSGPYLLNMLYDTNNGVNATEDNRNARNSYISSALSSSAADDKEKGYHNNDEKKINGVYKQKLKIAVGQCIHLMLKLVVIMMILLWKWMLGRVTLNDSLLYFNIVLNCDFDSAHISIKL